LMCLNIAVSPKNWAGPFFKLLIFLMFVMMLLDGIQDPGTSGGDASEVYAEHYLLKE